MSLAVFVKEESKGKSLVPFFSFFRLVNEKGRAK